MAEETKDFYDFGPFRADIVRRLLIRDGQPVPLTSKAFETLEVLLRHRDRVLEKEELLKAIWPDSFVEEANLVQNVSTLRKALCELPGEHRYIATVPGRGYRFVGQVQAPEAGGENAGDKLDAIPGGRNRLLIIGLCLAMALAGVAIWQWRIRRTGDAIPSAVARRSPVSPVDLPAWRRVSRRGPCRCGDYSPEQRAGAGGTADGRGPAICQRSCGSSGRRPRPEGGGTPQRKHSTVRQPHSHHRPVDSRRRRTAAVGGDIRRDPCRLVRHRGLGFVPGGRNGPGLAGTERTTGAPLPKTWRPGGTISQGRYSEFRFTREGMQKAVEYFHHALALDPGYAIAWAGLADAYTTASDWVLPPREALPKAEAAARRALSFDGRLAEAHGSLGHALMHEWRLTEAGEEFHRALSLNPNNTSIYFAWSEYLSAVGRYDEGVAALEKARQLDPLSPVLPTMVSWCLYLKGDYTGASQAADAAIQLDPGFWFAHMENGYDWLALGRYPEAIAQFGKAVSLNPESTIS